MLYRTAVADTHSYSNLFKITVIHTETHTPSSDRTNITQSVKGEKMAKDWFILAGAGEMRVVDSRK